MTHVFAWLLFAAGLLLVRPSSAERSSAERSSTARSSTAQRSPRPRKPSSRRALQLSGVLSVSGASVALLGPIAGVLCATALGPLAWALVARLYARPPRLQDGAGLAFTLDLIGSALQAGQPLASALLLAAPAAEPAVSQRLLRVAGLLQLGADPVEAWAVVADVPIFEPVVAAARRSSASGIRLAAEFEHVAAGLRASGRAAAEARAHRAGVLAVAPLGLCFLPAFVCLGIVPVIVGIAGGVLTSMH